MSMKKFLFIATACIFVATIKSMQDEELKSCWSLMSLEFMHAVKQKNISSHEKVMYKFETFKEDLCISYSLRSIDPVNVTFEGQENVDLTPDPEKSIVLDPQFWPKRWCLCSKRANTNDHFRILMRPFADKIEETYYQEIIPIIPVKTWVYGPQYRLFEGINNHRLALFAISDAKLHQLCVFHQSSDNSGTVKPEAYTQPAMVQNGWLRSLLLHREMNRCVRGIKNAYDNVGKPHCITIGDICERINKNTETLISTMWGLPSPHEHMLVASLATDFVLRKAIYLGKNTYLGLTEEGNLLSFWLDDQNQLGYAFQKTGKTFKDIDVDETVKTDSGFMPRVGLLAKNGDVYLTDLRMGKSPILLYSRTLGYPDYIFRFFYDKEQCAVVYNKAMGGYDTFHVWPDNFNLLLACASFKYGQQKYGQSAMAIEEK